MMRQSNRTYRTIRAAAVALGLATALGACASGDVSDEDRAVREDRLEAVDRTAETNNRERRERVDRPRPPRPPREP